MTKKTIIICTNDSWYALKFRRDLIQGLVRDGFAVLVVSGDDDYREQLRNEGADLITVPLQPRSTSIISILKGVWGMVKVFRDIKPVAVLTFNPMATLVVSLATMIKYAPQVATVSGFGKYKGLVKSTKGFGPKAALRTAILHFLIKRPERVIVQNADDMDFVLTQRRTNQPTARVMGSGVDLTKYLPVKRDYNTKTVLFAARFLYGKGILDFIKAGQTLASENFRFAICGLPISGSDGLSEAELKGILQGTKIEYLGQIDDMTGLLQETDILVLPSRYGEGIPRILIEGAASGCVLVAYDLDGVREIVIDGSTGRLIKEPKTEHLIEALAELGQADALTLAHMASGARERAESVFSVREVTEVYKKTVIEILKAQEQNH